MSKQINTDFKHQCIGTALRRLRRHNGLTIQQLSQMTAITPKTISYIERGLIANPGYYTVCKLLSAMKEELYIGISISQLTKSYY